MDPEILGFLLHIFQIERDWKRHFIRTPRYSEKKYYFFTNAMQKIRFGASICQMDP